LWAWPRDRRLARSVQNYPIRRARVEKAHSDTRESSKKNQSHALRSPSLTPTLTHATRIRLRELHGAGRLAPPDHIGGSGLWPHSDHIGGSGLEASSSGCSRAQSCPMASAVRVSSGGGMVRSRPSQPAHAPPTRAGIRPGLVGALGADSDWRVEGESDRADNLI
jgi:hypothetical protein